jgi:hypothetical protein
MDRGAFRVQFNWLMRNEKFGVRNSEVQVIPAADWYMPFHSSLGIVNGRMTS